MGGFQVKNLETPHLVNLSGGGGFPGFDLETPRGGFLILTWKPPGGVPGGFPFGQHCRSIQYAFSTPFKCDTYMIYTKGWIILVLDVKRLKLIWFDVHKF